MTSASPAKVTNSAAQPSSGPNRPTPCDTWSKRKPASYRSARHGQDVIACAAIASRGMLNPRTGRPQGTGGPMARSLSKASRIQMRTDRRRAIQDHRRNRRRFAPTLARRDKRRSHRRLWFRDHQRVPPHRPSAFFHVLNRIPARYWLGLTATPERRDGLEDLIYHQLGSHHVTLEGPTAGTPLGRYRLLAPHPSYTFIPPGSATRASRPQRTRRNRRNLPSIDRR